MGIKIVTKRASIVLMFFLFVSINILGQKARAKDFYMYFYDYEGKYKVKKNVGSETLRFYFVDASSLYYDFENYYKINKKTVVDVDEVAKMQFLDPHDVFKKYWIFRKGEVDNPRNREKKHGRGFCDDDFNRVFIIEYDEKNNKFYKYKVSVLFPMIEPSDIFCE